MICIGRAAGRKVGCYSFEHSQPQLAWAALSTTGKRWQCDASQ